MSIDEMIAVLQAAKEGKEIQLSRRHPRSNWGRKNDDDAWEFALNDYRVKPNEPREVWIPEDDNGALVLYRADVGNVVLEPGHKRVKFREVIE